MNDYSLNILNLQKNKIAQFEAKGIHTLGDLATYFPRKYYDFRKVTHVSDVINGEMYVLSGRVIDIREGIGRYSVICEETVPDQSGKKQQFCVVWFGQGYQVSKIKVGYVYYFCGKATYFRDTVQICPPIAFSEKRDEVCKIMPVYSKIKGMSNEYLIDKIAQAIAYLGLSYEYSKKDDVAKELDLMPFISAISQMHDPKSTEEYKMAASRIAFETIYDFYEELKSRSACETSSVVGVGSDKLVSTAISSLPFALTSDQRSTVDKIIADARAGKRINVLISGDVGCGKTIVAILSSIFMYEGGYQTIVMAPTLVLAQQHYLEFMKVLKPLGIKAALLTTDTSKKARKKLCEDFKSGAINILIGTHAVLNSEIIPYKLGLTVVDEEHKFGVDQKNALVGMDQAGIHHISMTATPIPRSIANTVYGMDTDVIQIRTMPNGRLPIKTAQYFSSREAFEKIYEEVQSGHQAYIVCPFIEPSDMEQFANVVSVSAVKTATDKYYATKQTPVRTAVLTGDMPQKEVLAVIDQFAKHEVDVLISTTIVEVGVNVPNATVIAIMSAERFGLAALHQLRGRVGRSTYQSYCLLCSPQRTERLDVLCATNDGFEIAEKDMQMRGPGDIVGTAQSGASKQIETVIRFPRLAAAVRSKIC